jgi:ABC-type antimicrobial peptide transport system permease subunit
VAAGGVAAGLAGAAALAQVLRNLLFGIRTTDPLTFIVIATGLGIIALGATYVPALRAARIDPIVSLRND